ncbi:hypothetical protein [Dysgonomonas sp. 521]|uniref:hypothetical protein n=1 Tax=Dysgonomonas sp. 521 TaxID=2302932 RepID=UPI0013D77768|nr:hypothetical protein [Dysgonomonas sp. 521]
MDIRKYIIFLIAMLLLPLLGYAQKIGDKYIVTTNDTTRIVSGRGMKDPENGFLRKNNLPGADSVYANMRSDYNSLEAATLDIDRMIGEIENDQTLLKTGNIGLGYRLSKMNVDNREKEKKAKVMADSIRQEMMKKSAEELAQRYAYYGDKPSYFINDIQVDPDVVGRLVHGEIIERKMEIQNTSSGNPNGEVRIIVTDNAARKIGVPELFGGEIDNGFRGRGASAPDAASSSKTEKPKETEKLKETVQPQSVARDVKKENVRTSAPKRNTPAAKSSKPPVEKSKPSIEKSKPAEDNTVKRSVRRIKMDRENRKDKKEAKKETQPVVESAPRPAPVTTQPRAKEPTKEAARQPQSQKATEQTKAETSSQPKAETIQPKPEKATSTPTEVRGTIVLSRTVNNVEVEVSEPVDSTGNPQD